VPFDEKSLAAPNLDKATEKMLLDDEVGTLRKHTLHSTPLHYTTHTHTHTHSLSLSLILSLTQVMKKLTESVKLDDVNALDFDAVFIPGGHGTCWDLPTNETLKKQVSAAFQAGKVVSAVW
jgi:hypothetical protein